MKDMRLNVRRFFWLQNPSYHSTQQLGECKSNQSVAFVVIGKVLSLLSHRAAVPKVTLASDRDRGVRGDVTVKSKAAGDHPDQLFTKISAGRGKGRSGVRPLPASIFTPKCAL